LEQTLTDTPLIAIVDDDDAVRAAMDKLARSLGLSTCAFASAEAFLKSSFIPKTRCLILDVQMPNMNGIELQERLACLGFEMPIIFITAYPDEDVKARALRAGAVGFFHKPLELNGQAIVDCLYAALERSKGARPDS
jgi:FixJ family two-component response regulator